MPVHVTAPQAPMVPRLTEIDMAYGMRVRCVGAVDELALRREIGVLGQAG